MGDALLLDVHENQSDPMLARRLQTQIPKLRPQTTTPMTPTVTSCLAYMENSVKDRDNEVTDVD